MRNILIPTDFSSIANNAMEYAIEIAAKFDSELLLYHVYFFHKKFDYDSNYSPDNQPFVRNLEQKMHLTRLKFKKAIIQKGLSVKTMVEEGNIASLFTRKVIKHDINLIVMGSKGASGIEKTIFGSVAATALEMAKVPVLVIPPAYTFRPIKRIVLASDMEEVSPGILSPLQKLAKKFDSKVTILNVISDPRKSTPQKNEFNLRGVETTYREIPISKSINESINSFIKQNNFDLLCMVRREKGFFEGLFKRSVTKAQVYNSEIPLLVIPE
jgi:nucleotide-binding universal stress UspA family protein